MASTTGGVQVAIVGIAAQLPSGAYSDKNLDYQAFFQFLLEKGEAYEKIPLERFNIDHLRGDGLGHIVSDTGAFLKDVHLLDYLEFGITSKDARFMPLSTRRLLETTFLALLDSGIDYRGKNVGCYMSGVAHDMITISGHDDGEARGTFAGGPAMVANRVSYHLDLRGPSVPVDTACSSSLYGTHLAVQALRNGECEAAVVGGCQINHRLAEWFMYSQGGILSRDGKCKPFDASADGFGRGEGVVSIVLKPLNTALRDHDHIYGTILGTGVNSSGSLAPVNAPVASAQQDAMLRAFAQAQRRPQDVDFIELHATGTAQGDPTEANWVGAQFKRDDELLVGSIKGNIGHLEITAFLASLCKVCSMFRTGVAPPNVNFVRPNPAIQWEEYKLRVPTEPELLASRSSSGCLLVAMASSGIGGANGHCVIEGPPSARRALSSLWRSSALGLSLIIAAGLSPRSVTAIEDDLKGLIAKEDANVVSRVYGRRSRSLTWRSFSIAQHGQLSRFSEQMIIPKSAPPVVYVFSGQGPQHFDMGRDLYKTSAVFRATVREMDKVYRDAMGLSLVDQIGLFDDKDSINGLGSIWPVAVTLPALTMLQIALVDTLSGLGVKADVVIGHSAGETAVLYASGACSAAMAMEIAIARAKAMTVLEDRNGAMAALACSPHQAQEVISSVLLDAGPGFLSIGCYNSPDAVTLSGASSHVDLAVKKAIAHGIFARRLRTHIPVHSDMMDLCQDEYEILLAEVFARYSLKRPIIEVYSTMTGAQYESPFDASYFWDSARGPVHFTPAVEAILAKYPNAAFVEVGPHPVLISYLTSMIDERNANVIPTLRRPKVQAPGAELFSFLECLGMLVVYGCSTIDFDVLCGVVEASEGSIPEYPFSRKDVPYLAHTHHVARMKQVRNGPLNYPQLQINAKTHPDLAEHVIKDEPIMPATGYIEMALEFGARKLWSVEFVSFLALSSERPTPVHVDLEGPRWTVQSASPMIFANEWPPKYDRVHARGYLSKTYEAGDEKPPINLTEVRKRLKPIDMRDFYDGFTNFASYGPIYQRVVACSRGMDGSGREEFLMQVRGGEDDLENLDQYRIHPAILDAALHGLVHPALTGNKNDRDPRYFLPSRTAAFVLHDGLVTRPFPPVVYTYSTITKWTPECVVCDVILVDGEGIRLCTFDGFEIARHGQFTREVKRRNELIHRPTSLSVPRRSADSETMASPGNGCLLDVPVLPLSKQRRGRDLSTGNASDSGYSSLSDTELNASPHHAARASYILFEYVRGKEMELQPLIMTLDPLDKLEVWFIASAGLDGDAGVGFTKSLRREYRSWVVRMAVFEGSWTVEERNEAIKYLSLRPECEVEIMIDSYGSVLAPRIVATTPPTSVSAFRLEYPWICDQSSVKQTVTPYIPEGFALVRVDCLARGPGQLWAFFGGTEHIPGMIAGITSGPISNFVLSHKESLVEYPHSADFHSAPPLLALTIAALALGPSTFSKPARLCRETILVTDADTELGSQVASIYTQLGLSVLTLPADIRFSELLTLPKRPRFIVSGSEDTGVIKMLRELTSGFGKVFLWNDNSAGIAGLVDTDPWLVADALRCGISGTTLINESFCSPSEFLSEVPTCISVPLTHDVFNPEKAYLLVGGIGSLGLRVALWMYEKGAREIILTSRSGREGIIRRDEFVCQRIMVYLESLPDLVLRVEAIDALSVQQMKHLVDSLGRPLGGCMILTAILIDRTFASQTAETFEAPISSKVNVLRTIEEVISIASLDFLIAFSSVCGLFGNAGQTNYACANMALTGLMRKYKNATTIAVPFIFDTGYQIYISSSDTLRWARMKHLMSWSMSSAELCDCIEDSIRMLREGPIWQYIPDLDWNLVRSNLGPSPMYNDLISDGSSMSPDLAEPEGSNLREIVCKTLDLTSEDLSADVPFISYGLDSLSAASLSYALRPLVAVSQIQLLADLTLTDLELRTEEAGRAHTSSLSGGSTDVDQHRFQSKSVEMLDMVDKYTTGFPHRSPVSTSTVERPKIILITGTTGSLGAHLLAHLLQLDGVQTIYALVRKRAGMSSMNRQVAAFTAQALVCSLLNSERLVLLDGDLHEPSLGLQAYDYDKLRSSLTHIVHLAWPIDLTSSLAAFEPAINVLRRLIDLSSGFLDRPPPRLIFASSTGIYRRIESLNALREEPIDDPTVAIDSGYTESKWVSEQVLAVAAEHNLVQPVIVRISQLSGSRNGAWKVTEWVPSLVSASCAMGCLPDAVGSVSWIPVDIAASVLADMLDSSRPVLHLRNPQPVSWSHMMAHFSAMLNLPLVSYPEWVARLERDMADVEKARSPYLQAGIRLLEFFRVGSDPDHQNRVGNAMTGSRPIVVELEEARKVSKTLDAGVPQLGEEDVRRWVEWWRTTGQLPTM
ncbi:uncharacterized protein FIBRA_00274 [Fibroporia radiculosa]|uniref:Carrier domain-containing protein n=1 Tax=Fibroporia radiculosa TaxID=599839 RepID=J7RVA3_9APHY|nr:uncharacterized protein FIBRA_00274 [Fibroporia radiculosa]CCL98280.1 predicted protein [Fibroporia radiculosa]